MSGLKKDATESLAVFSPPFALALLYFSLDEVQGSRKTGRAVPADAPCDGVQPAHKGIQQQGYGRIQEQSLSETIQLEE